MHYPYQAPAQPLYERPAPPPAAWVSWVILASAIGGVLGMMGGVAMMVVVGIANDNGDHDLDALGGLGGLVFLLSFAFLAVKFVVRLIWLHGCWSWLPPEHRVTSSGKRVTPGTAVGFLFIPYFNMYWMFVAYVGLCDVLDRFVQHYRTPTRAPRGLAIGACVCELLPFANLLIAPFLWFFVVSRVTKTTTEIAQAMSIEKGPRGFTTPGAAY